MIYFILFVIPPHSTTERLRPAELLDRRVCRLLSQPRQAGNVKNHQRSAAGQQRGSRHAKRHTDEKTINPHIDASAAAAIHSDVAQQKSVVHARQPNAQSANAQDTTQPQLWPAQSDTESQTTKRRWRRRRRRRIPSGRLQYAAKIVIQPIDDNVIARKVQRPQQLSSFANLRQHSERFHGLHSGNASQSQRCASRPSLRRRRWRRRRPAAIQTVASRSIRSVNAATPGQTQTTCRPALVATECDALSTTRL